MFAPIYHTLAVTKIRRTRCFTGKGDLLVRVGQKLNAGDVIATYYPEEIYTQYNLKRLLNLDTLEEARRSINLSGGNLLKKGDVIAETKGLFAKSIKAQEDCVVVSISGSQVLCRVLKNPKSLLAGFDSTVIEILPERGAILENDGALIQGAWGNQKVGSGMFYCLVSQADEELTMNLIDVSMRGAIIMAGTCNNPEVLKIADELPLKGIILASMHPDLIPLALQIEVPIMLIEGFGQIPMNGRAFDLLRSNQKRTVSINTIYNHRSLEKPEIVIPLPVDGHLATEIIEFKKGKVVRVNSGPHIGKAATIVKMNQNLTTLPNGVRSICAQVEFQEEDLAMIPLANLDILE